MKKPIKNLGKYPAKRLTGERIAMLKGGMEVMTASRSVASVMKDYEVEKLDAETELRAFGRIVVLLQNDPTFDVAEKACRASRRVWIAVDEEAWALGEHSEQSKKHREDALALIEKAVSLRTATLDAIPHAQRPKVGRFFDNFTARYGDIVGDAH